MRKELDLERMLEKEEQQKEDEEMVELVQQVEIEKKKDECLIKAIKQKEMEDQFNLARSLGSCQVRPLSKINSTLKPGTIGSSSVLKLIKNEASDKILTRKRFLEN